MLRNDLSNKLIHLIKASDDSQGSTILENILREKRLLGSNKMRKGNIASICFSEAPIIEFRKLLDAHNHYSGYRNFGIMVDKRWFYENGGRPVIYQSGDEYNLLDISQQYRHVTYDPAGTDWTWEREWRMRGDNLLLDPEHTTVIVPNRKWAQKLILDPYKEMISQHVINLGEIGCQALNIELLWHFIVIEDMN